MPVGLARYERSVTAEPVGVVRLQEDAAATARNLIQATDATARVAFNTLALAERQYLDEFQIRQREKLTELTTKHQLDPDAFKKEWQAHSEGVLGTVPGAFSARARTTLGDLGTRGHAGLVEFQNANARRNAATTWEQAKTLVENDYLAAVRRKDTAAMERFARDYRLHLEDGRKLQLVDDKGMAQQADRLHAMGAAALAADDIEAAWRKGGMPAARKKMKEFETDPAYSAARTTPTSFETMKGEAWKRVRELEADARRGESETADGVRLQMARAAEGLPLDMDFLGRAAKVYGPTTRLGKVIGTLVEKAPVIESFRGASLQDQAGALADLDRQLEDPKNPNLESLTVQRDVLRAIHSRAAAAMKRDSFTYANKVHAKIEVQDIDFTRPEASAEEFAKRREIVAKSEPLVGAQVLPFSAEEMGRFASTWNAAAPADKARIAASLEGGLGPALSSRVLGTLSKDGNVDRAAVFAAGVARQNPALSREIYEGLGVLRTEKKAAPQKEEDFQRAFNEYAGTAYKHSIEARDGAYEAARALTALWAKNNGKIGEELPADQRTKIIERVVGPTVRHHGSILLPPRRDMDQRGFDGLLSNIRDQDAPKLKAADGSEVTMTKALRSGVLENIGDGRYVLRFGENYYLTDPANPRRPFVLDRGFFEGVDARVAAEDMAAFTGGEQKPRRSTIPFGDERMRHPATGEPLTIPRGAQP